MSLIKQYITGKLGVHHRLFQCPIIANKFLKTIVCIFFNVWGYLPGWVHLHHWQLLWHQGIWRCCWGPCTVGHLLEWGVADSNCMGMGKGTDHVVSFHGYISASLEQVIPSRYCHPVKLSGSVLLCHLYLLTIYWEGGEPIMSSSGKWSSILIWKTTPIFISYTF